MAGTARLRKEFARLSRNPVALIEATPLEHNMFEWRYCLTGPADTPYAGGLFHGKVVFPPNCEFFFCCTLFVVVFK
jgi:ubiquitin-protein ligase